MKFDSHSGVIEIGQNERIDENNTKNNLDTVTDV
jgi:hypothetical protein